MNNVLFVSAQILFAVLPSVGLYTIRAAKPLLTFWKGVNVLAAVCAFCLITALFILQNDVLKIAFSALNLVLRLVELVALLYFHKSHVAVAESAFVS